MNHIMDETLVLCDFDALMLAPDGNMPQVLRDVLMLFTARGGRLTVFSQRTPRAVRTVLGSVRLAAPALVCGGSLLYNFADGQSTALAGMEALGDDFLASLPTAPGVGVALQMKDGATRVLRMSKTLEAHLHREWTPYLLGKPEGLHSADVLRVLLYQDSKNISVLQLFERALVQSAAPVKAEHYGTDCLILTPKELRPQNAFEALCSAAGIQPEQVAVVAGGAPLLELMQLAGHSAAASDAPAEVRMAAEQLLLCHCAEGAAAEYLYGLVRKAEIAG